MQMTVGMLQKSAPYLGSLVSSVVVHHEMDRLTGGNLRSDLFEEAQKLLVPMTTMAGANDLTSGNVQSRKQRCGPVADVMVSLAFGNSRA